MSHQGYGFCEFLTEQDADYACKIMNQIKLYGKPIRVNKVSTNPTRSHCPPPSPADSPPRPFAGLVRPSPNRHRRQPVCRQPRPPRRRDPPLHHLLLVRDPRPARQDRPRLDHRPVQGLRLPRVRLVRGLGRGRRRHGGPVPRQQARHGQLRDEEGRHPRRAPRDPGRAAPGGAGEEEPCPAGAAAAGVDDGAAGRGDGGERVWAEGRDAGAGAGGAVRGYAGDAGDARHVSAAAATTSAWVRTAATVRAAAAAAAAGLRWDSAAPSWVWSAARRVPAAGRADLATATATGRLPGLSAPTRPAAVLSAGTSSASPRISVDVESCGGVVIVVRLPTGETDNLTGAVRHSLEV